MHRYRLLCFVVAACALFAGTALGQSKSAKEKSPGDVAAEEFFKLRDDKDVAPTPARFATLISTGLAFITQYPTHGRTAAVINGLATFGTTIKDKKLAPMRAYWLATLKYEILRQGGSSTLTEDAQTAFKALGAATAGATARDDMGRDNLDAYRDRIDRLAEMPNASRFLAEQEKGYLELLRGQRGDGYQKQLEKLLAHPDKKVVAMAQDEKNLMEMRQGPLELKAATLDGKGFDAAALRGKVVYFVFWSVANEASVKELAELKDLYGPYQKLGVEIVTVAQDTDRDALAKFVKEKRYAWPVLFDGQGATGDFSAKLNARSLPASALFDQQGMFVATGIRSNKLEPEVMKLGIKKK